MNNLFIHTFVELKFNFEKRLIIFRLDSGLQEFAPLQVFRKGNGGSFGQFFIGNFRLGVVLNFMKPSLDDNSVPVVIVFVGKIRGELQHA